MPWMFEFKMRWHINRRLSAYHRRWWWWCGSVLQHQGTVAPIHFSLLHPDAAAASFTHSSVTHGSSSIPLSSALFNSSSFSQMLHCKVCRPQFDQVKHVWHSVCHLLYFDGGEKRHCVDRGLFWRPSSSTSTGHLAVVLEAGKEGRASLR